jgi:hypothetical protein
MAFLKNLFGSPARDVSYFDAVRSLAETLSREIPLPEWTSGTPAHYNYKEHKAVNAIKARLRDEMDIEAKRKGGTHMEFSPVIEAELDLLLSELALRTLAAESIDEVGDFGDEKGDFGANWQQAVSTYLKAWAAHSNPNILLDIAETLKWANRPQLARLAVNVTVPFAKFSLGRREVDYAIAAMIVRSAFPCQYPYGNFIEEHMDVAGMFSPSKLSLLNQRAARI